MGRVKKNIKRDEKVDLIPVKLITSKENINQILKSLVKPIAKLKSDPKNARKHDARSLEAIMGSFFQNHNRLLLSELRHGTVIAGNGTLAAATKLGWKNLACVTFEDAAKARAFAIADNRAAELSSWDVNELLTQLRDLTPKEYDIGFSPGEVQDLIDLQMNPFVTERVDVSRLKEHPKNYRQHPDDQLAHIMKSIETNGFYRSIVVANDYTILAGHGVVIAAKKLGKSRIPVIRLNVGPEDHRALKVVIADNEIGKLAETDDRALTELLKDIMGEAPENLMGTGFDQYQLAALAFTTRPASELGSMKEAADWVGLPEYDEGSYPIRLVMRFQSIEDRKKFVAKTKLKISASRGEKTWSTHWPWTEKEDLSAVRFVEKD